MIGIRKNIAFSVYEAIREGETTLEIVSTELSCDLPQFIRGKFSEVYMEENDCDDESDAEQWIEAETRFLDFYSTRGGLFNKNKSLKLTLSVEEFTLSVLC